MNTVKNIVKSEPVVSAAAIATIVGALLNLLVAFGLPITPEQSAAILDFTAVVAPALGVIAALIARRFVYSQESVDRDFTPDDSVVEYEVDGHVLAGEANELPTNTHVRELGDPDASV